VPLFQISIMLACFSHLRLLCRAAQLIYPEKEGEPGSARASDEHLIAIMRMVDLEYLLDRFNLDDVMKWDVCTRCSPFLHLAPPSRNALSTVGEHLASANAGRGAATPRASIYPFPGCLKPGTTRTITASRSGWPLSCICSLHADIHSTRSDSTEDHTSPPQK